MQIPDRLLALRPYGILTIAERVETPEMQQRCKALGFDFFQGFFFSRPQVVTQPGITPNRLVVMKLFARLQDPAVDIGELETLLAHDISLTYKLLRYVNSAAFALRREITSLRQAITLIGLIKIKHWLSLILATELADDKPHELVKVGLVRAKMCELLVTETDANLISSMFIVGLLSVLDALLDQPMIDLLDDLALSIDIKLALLSYEGECGILLKRVIAYTEGEWEVLQGESAQTIEHYTEAYLEAIRWSDESLKALFQQAKS